MTVKRNGDKVILKDGRVACSCCGECCMYPAAALVDDLYSYQDLPDAIDVGGIEYTKLDPPESVAGFTRYYINSNSEYLGILEGEGEDSTWTYEGGGGPCLISGFNGEGGEREDNFADTYTATLTGGYQVPPPPITLTRVSLCDWEGFEGDQLVRLRYQSPERPIDYNPNFSYKWTLSWRDCLRRKLNGIQNTPVGSYELCYGEEETCTIS